MAKQIRKTYKYRLYPTKEQSAKMHETCWICSIVYNRFIAERLNLYENIKALPFPPVEKVQYPTKKSQSHQLKDFKLDDEMFKQVGSGVLEDVAERVDISFQNFFRGAGYPHFKKARDYNSFRFPRSREFKVDGNRIKLPKIGEVKVKFHRPLEGKAKSVSIVRKNGKWYACFCVEMEVEELPKTGNAVGVDMGIIDFAITSDGQFFENNKFFKQSEKKMRRLQRKGSKQKKGSNRWKKTMKLQAKLHEKITNQRKNFHHNIARKLIDDNDLICFEALKIKNMTAKVKPKKDEKGKYKHNTGKKFKSRMNRYMLDAGWGNFKIITQQKADEAGRKVVMVNPKGTSQVCSQCGVIVKKELSERVHKCPECGLVIHRDVNAAIEILNRGKIELQKVVK